MVLFDCINILSLLDIDFAHKLKNKLTMKDSNLTKLSRKINITYC